MAQETFDHGPILYLLFIYETTTTTLALSDVAPAISRSPRPERPRPAERSPTDPPETSGWISWLELVPKILRFTFQDFSPQPLGHFGFELQFPAFQEIMEHRQNLADDPVGAFPHHPVNHLGRADRPCNRMFRWFDFGWDQKIPC